MKLNDNVKYIDNKGVEHNALVAGINGMHEGVIDLLYVQPNGEESKVFGVYPASHESKQEINPELPSYPLNAYKLPEEEHKALPADHPIHDHPFAPKEFDSDGNVIAKARPEYESHVAAHQDVSNLVEGSQASE